MNPKKEEELYLKIIRELYAAATPSADYDLLVENSPLDEDGRPVIPFTNYRLNNLIFDEIIYSNLKNVKIPKWQKSRIKTSIYLGPSPCYEYPLKFSPVKDE